MKTSDDFSQAGRRKKTGHFRRCGRAANAVRFLNRAKMLLKLQEHMVGGVGVVPGNASQIGKELYEFGPFRVDPQREILLRAGEPVPLAPKTFQILLVLVRHSQQVVTKDDLMKAVWPETINAASGMVEHEEDRAGAVFRPREQGEVIGAEVEHGERRRREGERPSAPASSAAPLRGSPAGLLRWWLSHRAAPERNQPDHAEAADWLF